MPTLRNIKHGQNQFYHYLLINGYIERVRRGVYKITPKGEKLRNIKLSFKLLENAITRKRECSSPTPAPLAFTCPVLLSFDASFH
jgi:hypothetical protein